MMRLLRDVWRKHEAELRGLFNGAIPGFVKESHPKERLDGVPVFSYHVVEPSQLEADLEFLRRNEYTTLRGRDLVSYLRGRTSVPERAVLLTFDDGPRNFFDVALPLLVRYGAQATAFVAPGLHAFGREEEDIKERPMTWEELQAVQQSGLVEVESHTLESRFVPRWPAPVPLAGCRWEIESARRREPLHLRDDLRRSMELIESRLPGASVTQLAFPMYVGNDYALELAREVGLQSCYWGLLPGRPVNRPGESEFRISRMSDEFIRRLPGDGRISLRELLLIRASRRRVGRGRRPAAAG